MDLSGLIFVVLAVAWAGYLIPRALRHHDEVAANRPVDSFSDTVRVLERTPATMKALLTPPSGQGAPEPAATQPAATARSLTRQTTRTAARRRRRMLGLLLTLTAGTAVAAGLGYLTWAYVAIPGALVVGWLVLCRLMVRRAPAAVRVAAGSEASMEASRDAALDAGSVDASMVVADRTVSSYGPSEPAPGAGPAVGPASDWDDDGSLWDPLPLTLPTYVTKPVARRTVRTIDLTQTGVTSSGHQAADSQLARAAEAQAAGKPPAPKQTEARKAAGA